VRRRTAAAIARLSLIVALAAGAAGSTGLPGSATGATLTQSFGDAADASVSSTSPSTSFGTVAGLFVETPRSDGGRVQHSYLRFNVQGLTAPVTSATLRLYSLDG